MQYHDQWTRAAQAAAGFNFPAELANIADCSECGKTTNFCRNCDGTRERLDADRVEVMRKFALGASSLQDLDETFKLKSDRCQWERTSLEPWRLFVENEIEKIKPFSTFCK
jgi:hypothetical protein